MVEKRLYDLVPVDLEPISTVEKYILDNGGVFTDDDRGVDLESIMEAIHGNGHAEDGAFSEN